MRIVEKCWIEIHGGYKTALSLETRLKSDWKRAVQVAQKRNAAVEKAKRTRIRKIAGITIIAFLFICILLCAGIYYIPESRIQLFVYSYLLAILGILAGMVYIYFWRSGTKAAEDQPSVAIVDPWWGLLSPKRYEMQKDGDIGEINFLKSLSFLDNNYIAVWGLLTSAKIRSDTDVLLLGPNGIWIFEVKYWNGIISKHDGVWTAGYQRGRNKIYDKSPDEQWLNQKQEISKTIKMQLSSRTWPADLIKGGIVFAHSKVVFGSITNPKASYGRPGAWHKRIRETKPLEGFNLSDRLEVLDALVLYANRHEKEEVKIVSASDMANELYNHAETALRKYVAERVK